MFWLYIYELKFYKKELLNKKLLKFNKNINHICIHEYVNIYKNYLLKFNFLSSINKLWVIFKYHNHITVAKSILFWFYIIVDNLQE